MFKLITEYIEGVVCGFCWGPGKTFSDVPTPKRITMTGSGFTGVFEPCNGTFIAEQEVGFPNRWHFVKGVVYGSWIVGPVNTAFIMGVTGEGDAFGTNEGLCVLSSMEDGKKIVVKVTDPPTPEYKIAFDENFAPAEKTHFLHLGPANSDEVLILACRPDQVKLHTKFVPDY